MRTYLKNIIFYACLLACALLVAFNAEAMRAARAGFDLWLNALMPALLPFFFFTTLMRATGLLSASTPFGLVVLGFISGAPSGAKLCSEAYGYDNAPQRVVAALNVISPMFIYGSFATAMLGVSSVAAPVILAQALTLVIVLPFALRSLPKGASQPPLAAERSFSIAFYEAVSTSMLNLLNICANIILFMVLIQLLQSTRILPVLAYPFGYLFSLFGAPRELGSAFLTGVLEVSNGCKALSALDLPLQAVCAVSAFFFSFGGLCVMAQSASFVRVEPKGYLKLKLLQGAIAAALAYMIAPLFAIEAAAVFNPSEMRSFSKNALSSAMIFAISLLGVSVVALLSAAAKRIRQRKAQ